MGLVGPGLQVGLRRTRIGKHRIGGLQAGVGRPRLASWCWQVNILGFAGWCWQVSGQAQMRRLAFWGWQAQVSGYQVGRPSLEDLGWQAPTCWGLLWFASLFVNPDLAEVKAGGGGGAPIRSPSDSHYSYVQLHSYP